MADLSYPLAASGRGHVGSATGTTVAEITLDAVVSGRLAPRDLAVAADTLHLQADFAEGGGNPQLDELLRFYEMLRPGRSSAQELDSLADELAARGAERCAALVREARAAYVRRGLIP